MRTRGSRTGTLVRTVVAVAIVITCVTVSVAVGGLLEFKSIGQKFVHTLTGTGGTITLPKPGAPETILVIGSDHRAGEPFTTANTDTMLLIRLNSVSSTINVMSVPRDLEVDIPEGGTTVSRKINAAYSIGGPNLLIKVLKTDVLRGLRINHVIDVNFSGFARLVDSIGCVYTDVDHRYYNDTAQTDYSSIDVDAGYQKLCGTQALQFVRFRHTDSDLVRNARQQDFVRWAKDQYGAANLLSQQSQLLGILGRNSVTDPGLRHTDELIDLFNLVVFAAGDQINQIKFPAIQSACNPGPANPVTGLVAGPGCYLTATPAGEARVLREFDTPTTGVKKTTAKATVKAKPIKANGAGLTADPEGRSQALILGRSGVPAYYPAKIQAGSQYCSSLTANCNSLPNPASEYIGQYPRQYVIHDQAGHVHAAYRMTLVINSGLGEYYGVQGTTWQTPPILRDPTQVQVVDGKHLAEYFDGHKLALVAWHTPAAVYWVSNTLTDDIPNHELIAIAASLRRP